MLSSSILRGWESSDDSRSTVSSRIWDLWKRPLLRVAVEEEKVLGFSIQTLRKFWETRMKYGEEGLKRLFDRVKGCISYRDEVGKKNWSDCYEESLWQFTKQVILKFKSCKMHWIGLIKTCTLKKLIKYFRDFERLQKARIISKSWVQD